MIGPNNLKLLFQKYSLPTRLTTLRISGILILVLVLNVVVSISGEGHPRSRDDLSSVNPSPYALSPIYLTFLAKQERKLYNAMKDYTKELEKRLLLVNRYTSDYESSSGSVATENNSTEVQDELIASNPVLVIRMLGRYANEFKALGQHIAKNAEEASSKIVHETKGTADFPSHSDSKDAMEALLRLQFMYDLKATELSEGIISGMNHSASGGLTTTQCYRLGKLAQRNKFYTLAMDWFNATKLKLENDPQRSKYNWNEKLLIVDMEKVMTVHNRDFEQLSEENYEYIFTKKLESADGPTPPPIRNQLLKDLAGQKLNESDPKFFPALEMTHIALCNGQNFQSPKEKARLSCWYDRKRNPYWTLFPLKLELLHKSPPIFQIHDIVNSNWSSYLKTLAYPSLERAPSGPYATPRTAAYAWFEDNQIPRTPISRRIELITGLNVVGDKAAEHLQIAAYAFGGHVELHYDSKGPDDPNPDPKGDRVTAFLVYLNDVKEGGRTSFPKLGFAVEPVKGSAVLWYTNLRNGDPDPGTLHGACPLIYGQKWIATKWTHSNENIFKRPCALHPKL